MAKIKTGDVVFSEEQNCTVTVREVVEDGVVCDWFVGEFHHKKKLLLKKLRH